MNNPASNSPVPANAGATATSYGPDGIDGAAVGRTLGLSSLVLGIGGLLLSWALIGGIVGLVAVICGVMAIVKSQRAKQRILAAGRQPRTGGALGLGIIGIITGIAAIAITAALLVAAQDAINNCAHLDPESEQYRECLLEQTGLGEPR